MAKDPKQRRGIKSDRTNAEPPTIPKTSKNRDEDESPISGTHVPLALQQKCLDIFRDTFRPASSDLTCLQEVKGHLYRRDFDAAFGKEENLRVYASRWSPSRALGYVQILHHMTEKGLTGCLNEQSSIPFRMVCLGGGAGAELVAAAAWWNGRPRVSPDRALDGDLPRLDITLVDIADWDAVVLDLVKRITTPPELSKYASQAKREANRALISSDIMKVVFERRDVLSLAASEVEEMVKDATLVTIMFTLNELYSSSLHETTQLIARLTDAVAAGTHLLVVDSPGSYSTTAIKGADKKYPMHWLIDATLLGSPSEQQDGSGPKKWTKLISDNSTWFRLLTELSYPIDLENMRYQIHLYRRLEPQEHGGTVT